MPVSYEWTLEEINGSGDIIDIDFSDTLTFDKNLLTGNDLGLVRNDGNENAGVTDRFWAYVKNGKLPEFFKTAMGEPSGYKVPQKFHKELALYNK